MNPNYQREFHLLNGVSALNKDEKSTKKINAMANFIVYNELIQLYYQNGAFGKAFHHAFELWYKLQTGLSKTEWSREEKEAFTGSVYAALLMTEALISLQEFKSASLMAKVLFCF
jgi:hypothetical protein